MKFSTLSLIFDYENFMNIYKKNPFFTITDVQTQVEILRGSPKSVDQAENVKDILETLHNKKTKDKGMDNY